MPTAPYAETRVSLDGGAVQTGGITTTGGKVCQLTANPAGLAGATQYLWEIIDYPPGYATPAGWTLESDTRLTSTLQTPPPFTIDANAARWGKYIFSLTLNGGGPTVTNRTTVAELTAIAALVDTATAIKVLSPNGQPDIGFGEDSQFGGRRGWIFDLKATLRIVEALLGGGGGGALAHGALTGLTGDDHNAGANAYDLAARTLVAYTGAANTTALADWRKFITTSHGSANTLTIPPNGSVAYLTATMLMGANIGAGTMTLTAGAGVTLSGSVTVAANGWWWAKKTGTNTWQCFVGGGAGVSAGNGLTGTSTLSVLANGSTIDVSALGIKIAAGGVGTTELANGAVTPAKLSALSITDIAPVDACTSANITLSGAQTVDGVTLTNGVSRVLAAYQTAPAENGVYLYNSGGAWTRATDFDAASEFRRGPTFVITSGALFGGQVATVVTAPAVLGTDPVAFLVGRTSNFGTDDVRTNAHFVGATTGNPTAVSDNGSFESCTTSSGAARGLCHRQASADANGARAVLQKCRGTHAAPAAHSAGDALGELICRSYDGSAFYDAGVISFVGVAAGGTSKRCRMVVKAHDGVALRTIQQLEPIQVQTTGAALTTALSIAMAADDMFSMAVRWHGKQSGSSNRAIKEATIIARRIGSAHPTVTITPVTSLTKDDSAWGADTEITCTPNTGTDALDFSVKGKAATVIDWDVEVSWRAL